MTYSDVQRAAFKKAKSMDFEQLPDGEYQATLDKVQVKAFGQKAEKKAMLTYAVFSPDEHGGSTYTQFLSLDNTNAYGVLKSVLRKFGNNPEEMMIDDVEVAFQNAIGNEVHFKLETKNGYQNLYITAVVKGEKKPDPTEEMGDVPF